MKKDNDELFGKLKSQLLNIDPVYFVENYLTLDGKPFRIHGNGYRPFADIYRYIGIKALEPNSKPVIIVKGRQVGATTMASALEMYFMGCGLFGVGDKPPMRVMHTFPQLELAAAYSKTKLNQIINSSIIIGESTQDKKGAKPKSYMQSLLDQSSSTNDSLHFKQFANGNHLWVESTGLDADRIIGRTTDCIFFDEVQKTTDQAIGNALKILTTAKYGNKGIQVFFGTPRKKGSGFYKRWMVSTQQYYYLGCSNCKKHFPLYTPGSEEWEKIWLHGFIVKCTHCGHEQDKREAAERGKWVSLKPESDEDCKMIGFHINQLYMPFFTKEDILNEKPGIHPVNSERVYQNEVLGEFFQGDSAPITTEEIREACADPGRKFRGRISPGEEDFVVLGIDYGARADLEQLANPDKVKGIGQSYSTAVVLVAKGAGLLSIEFATKFKRNDFESKKGIIDQLMRQYSIQLAIGDIGYSNDFSEVLHSTYGDRYLVSRAHSKVNNYVKFNQESYPKEIVFERDHYIGEMFEQMKKGMVKFPFGDYEKVAWLIEHCASMEIKPSISRGGEPSIHYVKGSTPNDGFMALLNAYLAYKFLITQGFTVLNSNYKNKSLSELRKPMITTGYISRKF